MEPQEYTHVEIEGVLTPNLIACTRTPVPLAKHLRTTRTLDDATCPPCRMAMIHRARQLIDGTRPTAA